MFLVSIANKCRLHETKFPFEPTPTPFEPTASNPERKFPGKYKSLRMLSEIPDFSGSDKQKSPAVLTTRDFPKIYFP
jgi:hypothetical protein